MARQLRYFEALREAQAQLLATDPRTYVVGLGVPGPTGVFGTTKGLQEQYGADRVLDLIVENELRHDNVIRAVWKQTRRLQDPRRRRNGTEESSPATPLDGSDPPATQTA